MKTRTTRASLVAAAVAAAVFASGMANAATPRLPASATTAPGNYVDMQDYLSNADPWVDVTYYLKQNFDYICGDTICEGEYPNIEALGFACSVDKTTGLMGECSWAFTASKEHIRPADGKVIADIHTWHCKAPLAPMTRADDLVKALQGSRPMWAKLPNTNATIWDGLVDGCL